MTNVNREKILIEAIELFDQGKKPVEILELFPEAREELEEIFETIALLNDVKKEILPREILVSSLLKSQSKTQFGGAKAALSRLWGWKLVAPIGVFVVLIILLISSNFNPEQQMLSAELAADQFELALIREEAEAADFSEEFMSFLEEESSMQEIEIILTNL